MVNAIDNDITEKLGRRSKYNKIEPHLNFDTKYYKKSAS